MTHSIQLKALFSLSLAFCSTTLFSQVSDSNGLPEFVQQQLKHSAKQYLAFQNNKTNKGISNVVSMGNDPNCDVDINIANIQQVIDNGADEIRLADNASYTEDIFISNKNITIRGGFQDCEDANNDIQQNSKTLITGTGTASVISISGSDDTHEIVLQNLDIRNGSGSDFYYGGGISTLGAKANITLENVNVSNNQGGSGGGIAINEGETNLTMIDSLVLYNVAEVSGGGIHCAGENTSLAIFGESGVLNNTSLGDTGFDVGGGGIHLADGCTATVFSGSANNSSQVGISGNVSENNGGGVFVQSGAKLYLYGQEFCFFNVCYGNSSQPVNVTGNQARDNHVFDFYGNGGGIYAKDAESQVYMQGALINQNSAEQKGGGLYVFSSNFEISKNNKPCWDNLRCNLIQGNQVENSEDDETFGGGFYLQSGEPSLSHVFVEDNRADHGTAMYLRFSDLSVSSAVINNNGEGGQGDVLDLTVIAVEEQSTLSLEHVTITANQSVDAVIGRNDNSHFDLNVFSSIIHDENSGAFLSGGVAFVNANIDCLITHDTSEMNQLVATNFLDADPQFKNPAARDYHLNAATSPAVDFCVQHNSLGDLADMDDQPRGWDDDSIINNQNDDSYVYDAGADETYDNDIIFKDRFED